MDFVIPWVDGADHEWRQEFIRHTPADCADASPARYRDWGALKYWFRAVEMFAPWVRTIHFITFGHVPAWLNVDHPKLHIVRHSDYIPTKYLPTFNARTIELNLHRIRSLDEHYVYFNDDMYLLRPVSESFFFKHNKPCDSAILATITTAKFGHTLLADIGFIRDHLSNKHQSMIRHPFHWFNVRYGKYNISNALLAIASHSYTGFAQFHLPQPLCKSTLATLWRIGHDELDVSCRQRFRVHATVNIYIQRYWQLATGKFCPVRIRSRGHAFHLVDEPISKAISFIVNQSAPLVCINDHETIDHVDDEAKSVRDAFDKILPIKCSFEI